LRFRCANLALLHGVAPAAAPPPPYPHPPLPRFHRAAQDAEFQDYAVKLVERVRAEGKNPLPIILQLQKNMRQSLVG
jgi:hypothetical protein